MIFATNIFDFSFQRRDDARIVRLDLPAGSSEWIRNCHGVIMNLAFVCPCGCGDTTLIPVWNKTCGAIDPSNAKPPSVSWDWDGNEEAPTLKPSILRKSGCGWHGFLTKGEWIKA